MEIKRILEWFEVFRFVPATNLWWDQHFGEFNRRNIPLEAIAELILISEAAQLFFPL
jgi:hypothetical protein